MKLVVLGAGGYGRTVADLAEQLGYDVIVLDDNSDKKCDTFKEYNCPVIPAFGNNEFRLEWCKKILDAGGELATLIHPHAYVSPKATVERGTVILPGAIVNTGTKVGMGAIVNLGAMIDHDCIIEEGCHICVGAIEKGENRIPRCTKIEAGHIVERGKYSL